MPVHTGEIRRKKIYAGENRIKKGYAGDALFYSAEFDVYKNGTLGENVKLSGDHQGWNSNAVEQSTYSPKDDHIYLVGAGSGPGVTGKDNVDSAAWAVFDGVDFTGYDTLTMTFGFNSVSDAAPAILGVVESLPPNIYGASIPQTGVSYLAYSAYTTGVTYGNVSNVTISCDVSKIEGVKKILVMTYAASYNQAYYSRLYVGSVKLE